MPKLLATVSLADLPRAPFLPAPQPIPATSRVGDWCLAWSLVVQVCAAPAGPRTGRRGSLSRPGFGEEGPFRDLVMDGPGRLGPDFWVLHWGSMGLVVGCLAAPVQREIDGDDWVVRDGWVCKAGLLGKIFTALMMETEETPPSGTFHGE